MSENTPIGENDPEAYRQAADRVTEDGDNRFWVVQKRAHEGQEWSVAAILPSYDDAVRYMDDARDFYENCPEDTPDEYGRQTIQFRYGSRKSPTNFYSKWPPDSATDTDKEIDP